MKRMKVLFGNRRMMVLLTLAILVLAATALVASSASFTATSANPGNTFTAGIMSLGNSKDDLTGHHAVLTAAKMKPGDIVSGTVTITNGPDVSGKVTLSSSALSDAVGANLGKLSDTLTVVITNTTTGYQVYSGPIKSLPANSATKALGATWAVGESNAFSFVVTFPDNNKPASATTGDNAYQGSSMSIQFDWEAVSAN